MRYLYWDSNCFIGYLKGEEHGKEARLGVMQAVERGEAKIVTSAFTLVEVVKLKVREEDGPYFKTVGSESRQALEDCFSPKNGIIIVNVDVQTARRARQAVWDYGIDPKDAMHVGSAMQFADIGLDDGDTLTFQTFDKKLIAHANDIPGLDAAEPSTIEFPYQMALSHVN